MRNSARLAIIAALSLFAASWGFAQDAVIKELTGTVEFKLPGAETWENAVKDQAVAVNTVISTGFKSNALIDLGNSLINVRPLTRLSIRELRASAGTETVNVNLQTGRLRLDVNPPSGTRASVSVQGPMSVSSVRGTVFEVSVFELWVLEGSIEYRGNSGAPVIVDAVGYSNVDERTEQVVFTKAMVVNSLHPDQPIAFDSFNPFSVKGAMKIGEMEFGGEMTFD